MRYIRTLVVPIDSEAFVIDPTASCMGAFGRAYTIAACRVIITKRFHTALLLLLMCIRS